MKNILVVLGTRPEAIKLAPVALELASRPDAYNVILCNTEQQKELSNQTLSFFGLEADIRLDVMRPNQSLPEVNARILRRLSEVYAGRTIDATIVQGDTMSVFCGALTSFYNKVPVFHVEAGLRSHDLFEPFPEEALRQMTARITDLHFAPTAAARQALLAEGIADGRISVTGNTVIDALFCLSDEALAAAETRMTDAGVRLNDESVLVTVHRRENHGERLGNILGALKTLSGRFPDHQFVLPVHPNPNVKSRVHDELGALPNVLLMPPLDYPDLVCLMRNAKLVLTDSGGIQEEAPTFGSPVLVMRYETERKEGVEAGAAKLVGADVERILEEAEKVLSRPKAETRLDGAANPYGDGHAAGRIRELIDGYFAGRARA